MPTISKRRRANSELRPANPVSPEEAIAVLRSFKAPKFDQTVNAVVNLGIDPKQADQALRGSIAMPHGIGIIDQDFCGPGDELKLRVMNFTEAPVELKKGDRVCQAGFVRVDRAEWEEGEAVSETTRGGLGSTG